MIYVPLVLIGLCFGSFVNALVWRVYEQEKENSKKKPDKKYLAKLSITKGRSICPHCKHELAVRDLIPVLSWLSLKGKCRYCGKPISAQYPIVELGMVVLLVGSYLWWPNSFNTTQYELFGLWVVMMIGFLALTVYDLKWYLLPNRLLYPLFVPAVAWMAISVSTSHGKGLGYTLAEVVISMVIDGGLFYILYQVSAGKWIGGGDVRLGWLLGLLALTPARAVLVLFLASLLGTAFSLPLLVTKKLKRDSVVPFGPFLLLAAVLVQLFGASLLAWYDRTFLML